MKRFTFFVLDSDRELLLLLVDGVVVDVVSLLLGVLNDDERLSLSDG